MAMIMSCSRYVFRREISSQCPWLFQARRWLKKQKDAFFSLSPTEQELATPGLAAPPLQSTESSSPSGLSTAGLPKGFFKPFFLVKGVDPEGPAAIAVRSRTCIRGQELTGARDYATKTLSYPSEKRLSEI